MSMKLSLPVTVCSDFGNDSHNFATKKMSNICRLGPLTAVNSTEYQKYRRELATYTYAEEEPEILQSHLSLWCRNGHAELASLLKINALKQMNFVLFFFVLFL